MTHPVAQRRGNVLEPAASHSAGAPPAGLVSTVGSSAQLDAADGVSSPRETGTASGVPGVNVAERRRGQRPLCGGVGAEPPLPGQPRDGPSTDTGASAPSSLDTRDITRPPGDRSPESPGRHAWITEVGELTKQHRSIRAAEYRDRGLEVYAEKRALGYSRMYADDSWRWHRDRARGQRERPERVLNCGATIVRVECCECGNFYEKTNGCRVVLLCLRCRGAIAREKRAKFMRARATVVEDAAARGLLRVNRRGGRWSEKFVTLTAPHVAEHDIATRIRLHHAAWGIFLKRLNRHLRSVNAHHSTQWYRCFEWEPGSDRRGHPHIHMWMFSPYLDRERLLLHAWQDSLVAAGYPPESMRDRALHVEEATGDAGSAAELIKYMTKDITADGERVPPHLYAEVYEVIDRYRVTQGSSGFMKLADRDKRCECGAQSWNRSVVESARPESE
jgi:hypothetical protein